MHIRLLLLFVCLLLAEGTASGQQLLVTGNEAVYASVRRDLGSITFTGVAPPSDKRLSYPDNSSVTIRIGDSSYTNNIRSATPSTYLTGGSSAKPFDTIVTKWNRQGVEITQLVYPVPKEGKITVRYRLTNYTAAPVQASAQYLLDMQLGANDGGVTVLTPTNSTRAWTRYEPAPVHMVGMGAGASIRQLSALTGVASEAVFNDPWDNLTAPARVMLVDWAQVVDSVWYTGTSMPSTNIVDLALLMQWGQVSVPSGQTREIGSFQYGVAEYEVCLGSLHALLLHPHRLATQTANAIPVRAYVYNPTSQTHSNTSLTLQASRHFQILEALGSGRDTVDTDTIGALAANTFAYTDWTLRIRDLSLMVRSGTLSLGASSGQGTGLLGSCSNSVQLEMPLPDLLKPRITSTQVSCKTRCGTINVIDSARSDHGIARVSFAYNNFTIDTTNRFAYGALTTGFTYCVTDSMEDASMRVVVRDVWGNIDSIDIAYCTTPDTLSPLVIKDSLSDFSWRFRLSDARAWDRGLDSVRITADSNVTTFITADLRGRSNGVVTFAVADLRQNARACFDAVDVAGNPTLSYCVYYTAQIASVESGTSAIRLVPDRGGLRIQTEVDVAVRILDLLGREVTAWIAPAGSSYQSLSHLRSGTYFVEMVIGQTKRLDKIELVW